MVKPFNWGKLAMAIVWLILMLAAFGTGPANWAVFLILLSLAYTGL